MIEVSKMKLRARIGAIFMCLVFAFSICGNLKANEPLEIGMDAYVAEDGMLKLYVNHNQGENFDVAKEDIKVMFGNNEMVTKEITTLQEENVPISYKCVVDVSGSMSQARIDQAKEVIKDLATKKGPQDSIAITALGNELTQSKYMTDVDAIFEKADVLTLTHEDTNLYYAIVQEIKGLQTANEVGRKRCLIIFSDGADDQATGITKEEAESAVKDSHIPVFTVGLLKNKDNENAKEMAKVLGSFARMSSGGEHFAPELGEGSIETIAGTIVQKLNNSLVLKEGLEDVDVSGKEVVLKITVSTKEGETAEDSINVPESDIKIIHEEQLKLEKATATIAPTATPVVEEVEEVEETPAWRKYGIYILIVIIALLIILAIAYIIWQKKKENEKNNQMMQQGSTPGGMSVESMTMQVDGEKTIGGFENEGLTIAPNAGKATVSNKKKYKVTLVQMGKNASKKYEISLQDAHTIGRSSGKANLAMPEDTALSSVHATLLAEQGKIFIRDENSTNGTFVNGIPISGKFELNQDDTILLGSYEYRVSWK